MRAHPLPLLRKKQRTRALCPGIAPGSPRPPPWPSLRTAPPAACSPSHARPSGAAPPGPGSPAPSAAHPCPEGPISSPGCERPSRNGCRAVTRRALTTCPRSTRPTIGVARLACVVAFNARSSGRRESNPRQPAGTQEIYLLEMCAGTYPDCQSGCGGHWTSLDGTLVSRGAAGCPGCP